MTEGDDGLDWIGSQCGEWHSDHASQRKKVMTDTELVEAMCEAAAEHPDWANQSQMEAALSVARPIIERELLKRMMSAAVHGDYLPCIGQFIAEFDARERGIELDGDGE